MSAQCLILEAGGIVQVVAVHLPVQPDAQLHHLLQLGGVGRMKSDVVVQL